jgi:hypothetical protein
MLVELSTFKGPPDRLESAETLSRQVQSLYRPTIIIARGTPKKTIVGWIKNMRPERNHPAALPPRRADEKQSPRPKKLLKP